VNKISTFALRQQGFMPLLLLNDGNNQNLVLCAKKGTGKFPKLDLLKLC